MSEPSLQQVLRECVGEVLEKMFFIRTPGDSSGQSTASEDQLAAHLTFDGSPAGSLLLCITSGAARSISADFLGEEENVLSGQQVEEVICELANIICGSVLSRIESTATFSLHPPRILAPGDAAGFSGGTVHSVEIGDGVVTVTMYTDSPTCSEIAEFAY